MSIRVECHRAVIWLKGCPRCSGDLHENRDMWGSYVACVQCGYYLSDVEEVLLGRLPSRGRRTCRAGTGANAPVAVAVHYRPLQDSLLQQLLER